MFYFHEWKNAIERVLFFFGNICIDATWIRRLNLQSPVVYTEHVLEVEEWTLM